MTAGAGAMRVAIGLTLLARPESLPRAVGVDAVSARRMSWAVRMFASRDAALGAGAIHAVTTGRSVRPWLLAQVFADSSDAAAMMLASRQRQVSTARALALVTLAGSGVLGLVVAALSADAEPAE